MGRPTTKIDTGGELDEDAPDVDTEDTDEDRGDEDTGTDEGDDTGADDEDTDEDDEPDYDTVVASLTPAQRRALDNRIAAANSNAKTWRLRATGKDATWKRKPNPGDVPPRKPGSNGKPAPAAVDMDALKSEILADFQAQQTAQQVTAAADRALEAAGLVLPKDAAGREGALTRARRLLDLDGLEPGDVAHEVDALRASMPGLFAKRRAGARKGGVVGPAGGARNRKRGAAPADVADLFD